MCLVWMFNDIIMLVREVWPYCDIHTPGCWGSMVLSAVLGIFNPIGSLFYTLSVEKIGLSLSHLVPEILEPNVGLIFHQNILVNRF